ncbi:MULTISPECIES: RNA 2',3'-cyclic phosphodiesterase [unclassified Pseudomonas]|uniref:RNA 2',3'-cyclic phosphodiesterase n=1 Tax=unclassified Pseudomonas TaxID=196821 RepID=UPI000BD7D9FF|nr:MULTISPECIES: RNA 2',3'-cyclic phosphodiesterase [unclassified Pseudomonas]PVZ13868.1 2'-5' RNA ligase [Pseudomonas sp. URIL14HWK12:I12]PVZ24174.1 2'-5' RNA ligase [Pseudomonas sp. URIL14HWK12:I10]PVZ33187.1 2'-5' RNA ligase [Pseudomonas sp. URIL14HWK12:I11]SNZ10652.1 2'-5' RNA ligase [Pseudomonas sp. URIL14HWK12:I9]
MLPELLINRRLFFALDLPAPQRKAVARWRAELHLRAGKPVPSGNFHITLMFLGEVPLAQLEAIYDAVEAMPKPEGQVLLLLDQLDHWRAAEALVLAARQPPKALLRLVYNLEQALLPLGLGDTRREYRPHLTLARKYSGQIPEAGMAPEFMLRAGAFGLYESVRGQYRLLRSWALAG